MILELKDVQSFELTEEPNNDAMALRLSGLVFHSALAADKLTTAVEGSVLTVHIHLTPARKGLSGRFSYVVQVPAGITEVRFGSAERATIWQRKEANQPSR